MPKVFAIQQPLKVAVHVVCNALQTVLAAMNGATDTEPHRLLSLMQIE